MKDLCGIPVRILATPDVSPDLWGRNGIVLTAREDRVVVELPDGRDVGMLPDQIEPLGLPPHPE